MNRIQIENSFERDLKRLKKRKKDLSKLRVILELLEQGSPLPEKNKNHKLTGNYKNFWECHIEPDWLLVYKKSKTTIILVRSGSHSDLF